MRKLSAPTVWYVISAAGAFLHGAVFSVTAIYFVNELGFDPLELVLIGTAMEATNFVFEVPTGVVADVYSRRLSVILGVGLHGAAVLCVPLVGSWLGVLVCYGVMGLAWTFISGAIDAWLADEIGAERLGHAYFRATQLRQLSALLGIGVGVSLGTISLSLPILLGGAAMVGEALFLAAFMPETGFRPAARGQDSGFAAMAATLRHGVAQVRVQPVLILLLAVSGFMGLYSEGVDRLNELHLLKGFTFPTVLDLQPVVWLGVLKAGALLLGIGGAELTRRLVDPASTTAASRGLLVVTALEIAGLLAFAWAGSIALAIAAFWLAAIARTSAGPIYRTWLNRSLDSTSRATVISMSGQMDALGQIVGGPLVGQIGRSFSVRMALSVSALALAPALWLYARAWRFARRAAAARESERWDAWTERSQS